MGIFGFLPDACMAIAEQQRIRVAHLRFDDTEVAGGVEQAGIPAIPVWQQFFYLFAKIHRVNVYDTNRRNNDTVPILRPPQIGLAGWRALLSYVAA